MARKKNYVGITKDGGRERFLSASHPTEKSHGQRYLLVVGPFRTKRGAVVMTTYGGNGNPHLQHVHDAEKLARQLRGQNAFDERGDLIRPFGAELPKAESRVNAQQRPSCFRRN